MFKSCLLIIILSVTNLFSQSISVRDINYVKQHTVEANLILNNEYGKQVINASPEDFQVSENGINRKVLSVSNPINSTPKSTSTVFIIDVSSITSEDYQEIAQTIMHTWFKNMPKDSSECSIILLDDCGYVVQDITTNKNLLMEQSTSMFKGSDLNIRYALMNEINGAQKVLEQSRFENKEVILITNHYFSVFYDLQSIPDNMKLSIIGIDSKIIDEIKDKVTANGGNCYEYIKTKEEAQKLTRKLLHESLFKDYTILTWETQFPCKKEKREVQILWNHDITKTNYQIDTVKSLEFSVNFIDFQDIMHNGSVDTIITVTALGTDYAISDIISDNSEFEVAPRLFSLKENESKELTISYKPIDNNYTFGSLEVINDNCNTKLNLAGGYSNNPVRNSNLKLIEPKGNQSYLTHIDYPIVWSGGTPDDVINIYTRKKEDDTWKLYRIETEYDNPGKSTWWASLNENEDSAFYSFKLTALKKAKPVWETFSATGLDAAFSHDKSKVCISAPASLVILSTIDGSVLKKIHLSNYIVAPSNCVWRHDDKYVAYSNSSGVTIVEVETGKIISCKEGFEFQVRDIVFSKDGEYVVACGWAHELKSWDIATGNIYKKYDVYDEFRSLSELENLNDSLFLVSDYEVTKVYHIDKHYSGHTIDHLSNGSFFKVSHDLKKLAFFKEDKTINIVNIQDIDSLPIEKAFNVLQNNIELKTLQWSYDDTKLYIADESDYMYTISSTTGEVINKESMDLDFTIGPNDQIAKYNKELFLLEKTTSKDTIFSEYVNSSQITALKWSPDRKWILSGNRDGYIMLWDSEGNYVRTIAKIPYYYVRALKWSPDSKRFISTYDTYNAMIWDVTTGDEAHKLSGFSSDAQNFEWSADGSKIISGSSAQEVIMWDANSGQVLNRSEKIFSYVEYVHFSHDESKIAASDYYGNLLILDANTFETIKYIYEAVAYHDYRFLWKIDDSGIITGRKGVLNTTTWEFDKIGNIPINSNLNKQKSKYAYLESPNTIAITDTVGNTIEQLNTGKSQIEQLDWSPAGDQLLTGANDGTIKVWNLDNLYSHSVESDSTIKIKKPNFVFNDIMLYATTQVRLDTIIKDFFINNSDADVVVNKIYITDDYYNVFDIMSPTENLVVPKNQSLACNLSFYSHSGSLLKSKIHVDIDGRIYTSDLESTIHQVNSPYLAKDFYINFGDMELGNSRDSTDILIAHNYRDTTISIKEVIQTEPNIADFTLLSDISNIDLEPGEELKADISFHPTRPGIINGRLKLVVEGDYLPALRVLHGKSVLKDTISIDLQVGDTVASAGSEIVIPIILLDTYKIDLLDDLSFKAQLWFNPNLLSPIDYTSHKVDDNNAYIELTSTVNMNPGDTIVRVKFNTLASDLLYSDLILKDFQTSQFTFFDVDYGKFILLNPIGISEHPIENDKIILYPNPANSNITIESSNFDFLNASLYIFDTSGTLVYSNENQEKDSKINIDIENLPQGRYSLILKNRTDIEVSGFIIQR